MRWRWLALLCALGASGASAQSEEDEIAAAEAAPPPPRARPTPPHVHEVVGLLVAGRFANNRPLPVLGLSYEHLFGPWVGVYAALEGAGQRDDDWMPDLGYGGALGVRWYPWGLGPSGAYLGLDGTKLLFHRAEDAFFTLDAQAGYRWLLPRGWQVSLTAALGAAVPLGGGPVFNFAAEAGAGYAF